MSAFTVALGGNKDIEQCVQNDGFDPKQTSARTLCCDGQRSLLVLAAMVDCSSLA